MNSKRSLVLSVFGFLALCLSGSALAQWDLDSSESRISFLSIKNGSVAEVHRFEDLVGFVNPTGEINVTIDLASVETMIPIRDERMRDMLFETARFPTASVTADMDESILAALEEEGRLATDLEVTLSLHGVKHTLEVPVMVFADDDGGLRVLSRYPVVVRASDFGLEGGIETLREIAGLEGIATAVPVTVDLLFTGAGR